MAAVQLQGHLTYFAQHSLLNTQNLLSKSMYTFPESVNVLIINEFSLNVGARLALALLATPYS
jgi:hypothetical protein